MANSMDTILVKYGAKGINIYYDDYSQHPEVKTVTLPEFLAINPKELSEGERKIQEAIRFVYELNEKEPPLYKGFPNRDPEYPLTINCTGAIKCTPARAFYESGLNEICFINQEDDLIRSLSHELKHAEQHAQKENQQIFDGDDNLKKQQLFFLDEADAIYTDMLATTEAGETNSFLQKVIQEYTDENGHKDIQKIKQRTIRAIFRYLLKSEVHYIREAEITWPIKDTNKGLENIPEYYGLTPDFLNVLNKVPKKARTIAGKIRQCIENHQEDQIGTLDIPKEKRKNILVEFFSDKYNFKEFGNNILTSLFKLKESNGEPFFSKKDLIEFFTTIIKKEHPEFIYSVTDFFKEGKLRNRKIDLPFTSQDFEILQSTHTGLMRNDLLHFYPKNAEEETDIINKIPFFMNLRSSIDGKPLISNESWVLAISRWCPKMSPKNVQALFDALKDKNGYLKFSSDTFTIWKSRKGVNGMNSLLVLLELELGPNPTEEEKQDFLEKLPILMSLKGKNGQPIITERNISFHPINTVVFAATKEGIPFKEYIKKYRNLHTKICNAFKRYSIKHRLNIHMKAGGKRIRKTSPKSSSRPQNKKETPSL